MRELSVLRKVHQREAARANGRHVFNPTHTAAHAKFSGFDGEHMAMPEDTDNTVQCQDASGNFYFMIGHSSLGGGDVLK